MRVLSPCSVRSQVESPGAADTPQAACLLSKRGGSLCSKGWAPKIEGLAVRVPEGVPPGFRPPTSWLGLGLRFRVEMRERRERRERRALLTLLGHRSHLCGLHSLASSTHSPSQRPPPHTVTLGHGFNRGYGGDADIQFLKALQAQPTRQGLQTHAPRLGAFTQRGCSEPQSSRGV